MPTPGASPAPGPSSVAPNQFGPPVPKAVPGSAVTINPQKPAVGEVPRNPNELLAPEKVQNIPEIKTQRLLEYMPIQVIFLSGPYSGRKLELGLSVNEASQSQTADWQDQQGQAIRVGSNFVSLSPRTANVSVVFWSDKIDVAPYAEACASLMEIGEGDATPPRLHYQQGSIRMIPCVCTKFDPKYENPFPGNKGFRQVTVALDFKLLGGSDSPHRLGAPLTNTRLLQEKKNANSLGAYAKQGKALVLQDTLMHCLANDADQDKLKKLIENRNGHGQDPGNWEELSADGLIQAAVAGMIPPSVLKESGLQTKLQEALAMTIANKTYGLKDSQKEEYAMALRGQDFGLKDEIRDAATAKKGAYEKIYQSILSQDLGDGASVYSGENGELLIRAASCGLEYRSIGAARVAPVAENDERSKEFWKKALGDKEKFPGSHDKYLVDKINEFMRSDPSDEDIKKQFGLQSVEQIKALRAGGQFQSVDQFERYLSAGSNGIAGYVVYQNFLKFQIDASLGAAPTATATPHN